MPFHKITNCLNFCHPVFYFQRPLDLKYFELEHTYKFESKSKIVVELLAILPGESKTALYTVVCEDM